MKGRPKKNLKTSSLSDAEEVKSVDSGKVAAESVKTETAKEVKPAADITPAPDPKEVKPATTKTISPLLSEPVEIKDYAMGVGPTGGGSSSDLSALKVDSDFFSTPPVNPPLTKADLMSENKGPVPPGANPINFKPDAPEQPFNMNGGPEPIVIPDNVSRQAASELADTIMSMYERLVPEVSHEYVKLNTKEIKKLEASGDLMFGAYNDVVEANKENKRELEKRAHDDAVLIKKPLKKLLEVKQINAPPHIELIIILVFVAATYFMMVKGIKKSNDDLLAKLYEKINKDKAGTGVTKDPESDVVMAQTETVIK